MSDEANEGIRKDVRADSQGDTARAEKKVPSLRELSKFVDYFFSERMERVLPSVCKVLLDPSPKPAEFYGTGRVASSEGP